MNQLPYVEMSQQYGGKGGNPFNPQHEIDFSPNLRVQKVRVGHGGMIDSVQFVLTDGMNLYELPKLGGNGGTHAEWDVPMENSSQKLQSDTTNTAVVFSSSLIQESSLLSSENK